jgi:hypothetical protein
LVDEDNQYIINEMMKNPIIKEEFEMIRTEYGEDAY